MQARLGVLFGLFGEIEKASVKDSVQIDAMGTMSEFNPELLNDALRWEIRPTLDFQFSDRWSMKIRPYFKGPMPWEPTHKVNNQAIREELMQLPPTDSLPPVLPVPDDDDKFDFRVDLQTSLGFKLSKPEVFRSESFEFELSYRLLFDNAPPRAYVLTVGDDGTLATDLIKAEDTHHIIRFSAKVTWK